MTARLDDDRTQWEPGKDVAIEPECHACMDSGIVEECDNDRVRMVPCDGCAAGDRRKGEARADYEAMTAHLRWVERLGARVAEVDAATRGQSLGVVDWFPIQQVIETLDKLVQVRAMSDTRTIDAKCHTRGEAVQFLVEAEDDVDTTLTGGHAPKED